MERRRRSVKLNALEDGMGITIFEPARVPPSEDERTEAVYRSGLLHSHNFERLTALAIESREALSADWVGICMIYGEWQNVIASSGNMLGLYRRSASISSYIIELELGSLTVLDARRDNRFNGKDHVKSGIIQFYAGVPIIDPNHNAIGVICITNRSPRKHFTYADTAELLARSQSITEKYCRKD